MQTAKEVIKVVVDFLNYGSEHESQKLWDVLTALRGPDDGNVVLKEETTARIRYAIGLKTEAELNFERYFLPPHIGSRRYDRRGARIVDLPLPHYFVSSDGTTPLSHFQAHFNEAKLALELMDFVQANP